MKTYISLLRGINVSGKHLIKMDALKNLFQDLNLKNVQTYLQSGNVVFESEDDNISQLEIRIAQQITKSYGFDIPVLLLPVEILQAIIQDNPLSQDSLRDPSHLHVTFLKENSAPIDKQRIYDKLQAQEEVAFSDRAIYLYCPNGYGKTKITNTFIENTLKVTATTRNWNTTNQLLALTSTL